MLSAATSAHLVTITNSDNPYDNVPSSPSPIGDRICDNERMQDMQFYRNTNTSPPPRHQQAHRTTMPSDSITSNGGAPVAHNRTQTHNQHVDADPSTNPAANPLLSHLLSTLITSVQTLTPTLQRATTFETPLHAELTTHLHPLLPDFLAAQGITLPTADQREMQEHLEYAETELARQRTTWIEQDATIRAQRGEAAALHDELRLKRDDAERARTAARAARKEATKRYAENIDLLRTSTKREQVWRERCDSLERQVSRLRSGSMDLPALDDDDHEEEAALQPGFDEEDDEMMEGEGAADLQHVIEEDGDEEEEEEDDDDDDVVPAPAQQQHTQPQHQADDSSSPSADPVRVLRSTQRHKQALAGRVPAARSIFAVLQHQLESTAYSNGGAGRPFLLNPLATRAEVAARLDGMFEPLPSDVAASAARAAAAAAADAERAHVRDLLLARVQLKVADGSVPVELLADDVPVAAALVARVADMVDDERRVQRTRKFVEDGYMAGYCFRGAVVARRRPKFKNGAGRACQECAGGDKPCIVRDEEGQLCMLPRKDPEEGSWKEVEMWMGVPGVGGVHKRRKTKK